MPVWRMRAFSTAASRSVVASGSLIAAISPSVTDGAAPEALFPALEEFKRLTSFSHIPDGPETRKQRFWDDLAC